LYSCSHRPEEGNMSGRNVSLTTVQYNYIHYIKAYLLSF